MFYMLICLIIPLSDTPENRANHCSQNLLKAQRHYELGRFSQTLDLLTPCLASKLPEDVREGVLALSAKTRLALDQAEEAMDIMKQLLTTNPQYQPQVDDPRNYRELFNLMREDLFGGDELVRSVSKSPEYLREAPATVTILHRRDILDRGYIDLPSVLHDLAGFDIQTGSGDVYSNFNQRGYRSQNDRTLLLVDGVEANDLWRGVAYLSRQYPLSNIERVELIYGPASTMYGSHAFTGVINVITRDPSDYLKPNQNFGASILLGGGQWNTRYADASFAWRHPSRDMRLSLTTRFYLSDDPDLSQYQTWDYSPTYYDTLDYAHLTSDPELADLARRLDQQALDGQLKGHPIAFQDYAKDEMFQGRFEIRNLSLGFMSWRREENHTTWYTDNLYAGGDNGMRWVPEHDSFWLKYHTGLSSDLGLKVFARYKRHVLDKDTVEVQIANYSGGSLGLGDLTGENPVPSFWHDLHYNQSSSQFRIESQLSYQPGLRFALTGGLEIRQGIIQGDYIFRLDCPQYPDALCPKPGYNRADVEGQFFDTLDLGVYMQASRRFKEYWKIVAGGRLDWNRSRLAGGSFTREGSELPEPEGYGAVFNPRLAIVRHSGRLILKAIYAEAFKDASQWDKYATSPGFRDLPNPGLDPEKVKNTELTLNWKGKNGVNLDLATYRAVYSNGVTPQRVPFGNGDTLQNKAIGSLLIKGVQANFNYQWRKATIYANYAYTWPISKITDSDGVTSNVKVADIAPHHINAGVQRTFFSQLKINLRSNWSDAKRSGPGTTTPANPISSVDGYLLFHSAFTYESRRWPGLKPQLLIQNLTNTRFAYPGVSSADGIALAGVLPQPERSIFFRISYEY